MKKSGLPILLAFLLIGVAMTGLAAAEETTDEELGIQPSIETDIGYEVDEAVEYGLHIDGEPEDSAVVDLVLIDNQTDAVVETDTVTVDTASTLQSWDISESGEYIIDIEHITMRGSSGDLDVRVENSTAESFTVTQGLQPHEVHEQVIDIDTQENPEANESLQYTIDIEKSVPHDSELTIDLALVDRLSSTVVDTGNTTVTGDSAIDSWDNVESGVYQIRAESVHLNGNITVDAEDITSTDFLVSETIHRDGAGHTLSSTQESEIQDAYDVISGVGLEAPQHAFRFVTSDEEYLVLTSEEPTTSEVSFEGRAVGLTVDGAEIVVADEVQYIQEPTTVTWDELQQNTTAYEGEQIRVEGVLNERSIDFGGPQTIGWLHETQQSDENDRVSIDPLYDLIASTATDDVSPAEKELELLLDSPSTDSSVLVTEFHPRFWSDSDVVVEGVVEVQNEPTLGNEQVLEYTSANQEQVVIHSTAVDYKSTDISRISDAEGFSDGESITVDANLTGESLSTRSIVSDVSENCGSDTIVINEECFQIPADVTIYTGVAWDTHDNVSTSIPIVGFLGEEVSAQSPSLEGQYEITGELVTAEDIGIDSDEREWLLVHDLEPVSDGSVDTPTLYNNAANEISSSLDMYLDDGEQNERIELGLDEILHNETDREQEPIGQPGNETNGDNGTQEPIVNGGDSDTDELSFWGRIWNGIQAIWNRITGFLSNLI